MVITLIFVNTDTTNMQAIVTYWNYTFTIKL